MRHWLLLVLFASVGCTCILDRCLPGLKRGENETMSESIGVATMRADGTIVLQLRAESADGAVGDGYFTYAPTDKDYEMILQHLGGLEPGESKPVPPWPDS